MDDLISRRAAIDALKRDEALVRAFGYQHAIDAVQALPSAQPEIIRCKDCKYCYSFITARSADGLTEQMEYRCKNFNASVMPDEYCSRGERRDDAR